MNFISVKVGADTRHAPLYLIQASVVVINLFRDLSFSASTSVQASRRSVTSSRGQATVAVVVAQLAIGCGE